MDRIRPARIEDAAAIARLTTQLGYPIEADTTRRLLDYLIEDDDQEILVFDLEGVVGWAGVAVHHGLTGEPFAELAGLVVDETHRSHGIGRKLLFAAEDWARGRGFGKLRVRTNMIRADAHRFYERLGYGRVKEQRVYEKGL